MIRKKIYGEFKCPKCDAVFFQKHQLDSHNATHVKGTKPKCRICKTDLVENRNWMPSMVKASSRVCKKCMRTKNKQNYTARKKRLREKRTQ